MQNRRYQPIGWKFDPEVERNTSTNNTKPIMMLLPSGVVLRIGMKPGVCEKPRIQGPLRCL